MITDHRRRSRPGQPGSGHGNFLGARTGVWFGPGSLWPGRGGGEFDQPGKSSEKSCHFFTHQTFFEGKLIFFEVQEMEVRPPLAQKAIYANVTNKL